MVWIVGVFKNCKNWYFSVKFVILFEFFFNLVIMDI